MHCFAPRLVTSLCLALGCATFASAQSGVALVRHAPAIHGTVDGSVQQMLPESVSLDGTAAITSNLLVPGVPAVNIVGSPSFAGVVAGNGDATPANYTVTLAGNANLGHLVTSTDALPLPTVAPPPDPTGSATVTVTKSGQANIDFAALRNLTLNGNAGQIAVPPGTYGDFTANGANGFTLGVAGATEPAVYNFEHLLLNGTNGLTVVGPVVVTIANGPALSGAIGAAAHPGWLTLRVSSGDLTLNGNATLYGLVTAPNSQVTLEGGSQLIGGLTSDRLTLNGNALLRLEAVTTTPAPVAINQSVTTAENTPVPVTLAATQANGDALTYTVATQPAHGTLSGTAPNLTYTPALNYFGPDSFTFTASDGTVVSNTATVSITVNEVIYPPVATPQSLTLVENTTLPITLTGTQTNNDPLTFAVVTQPAHGTLSGVAPNLVYTPAQNYVGPDAFTFNAADGTVSSTAPATVSITVTKAPPTATDQTVSLVENMSAAITLSGTQVNGDALTFAIGTQPAHGTLSGTAPNFTYTPAPNFYGADSLTFTASDGPLSSAPATVSITVTKAPPVATPQALTVFENASLAMTLSGTQVNGDALTFAVATQPAHGSLTGTAPSLTYTPAANYSGPDSFTFVANDGAASSAPATISITVQPLVTTSTLSVINGVGTVLAGDTYTITSNPAPAGAIFAGWVVASGSGTFANAKLSQTTFAAAAQTASTIQATYVTLTPTTDVNGDGISDLLEIQAGVLDPNDPSNPNDPKNTASQANLQNYSYDTDNQLITAPESNYKYDKDGNASPDQK